jgi:hypothetical protein
MHDGIPGGGEAMDEDTLENRFWESSCGGGERLIGLLGLLHLPLCHLQLRDSFLEARHFQLDL